jgi:hypothetical protein
VAEKLIADPLARSAIKSRARELARFHGPSSASWAQGRWLTDHLKEVVRWNRLLWNFAMRSFQRVTWVRGAVAPLLGRVGVAGRTREATGSRIESTRAEEGSAAARCVEGMGRLLAEKVLGKPDIYLRSHHLMVDGTFNCELFHAWQ